MARRASITHLGDAESSRHSETIRSIEMEPKHNRGIISLILAIANFLWGVFFGVHPTFYPLEATRRGATPAQYANVHGVAFLGALLLSTLLATTEKRLFSLRQMLVISALVQAVSALAFGMLEFVDDTNTFIALSYVIRFVFGMADSVSLSSSIATFMLLFDDKLGLVLSAAATIFGLGHTFGPVMGSALYSLGGFKLPFVTLSLVMFILLPFLALFMPEGAKRTEEYETIGSSREQKRPKRLLSTLKSLRMWSPYLDCAVVCASSGFVQSLLAPHLVNLGASEFDVAIAFLVAGAVYCSLSPVIGYLCDRMRPPTLISALGALTSLTSLLLLGPAPFLCLPNSKYIGMMATSLVYMGQTQVSTSSLVRATCNAHDIGLSNDTNTYVTVSGLWTTFYFIGGFTGPLIGGYLVQFTDFPTASALMSLFSIFSLIIDLYILLVKKSMTGAEIAMNKM